MKPVYITITIAFLIGLSLEDLLYKDWYLIKNNCHKSKLIQFMMNTTDVNKEYLRRGQLHVDRFTRGFAWLDTGTHESLIQAGDFVQTIEQRQGLKIACIEEIAYNAGYIDADQLGRLANDINNDYGDYLRDLID